MSRQEGRGGGAPRPTHPPLGRRPAPSRGNPAWTPPPPLPASQQPDILTAHPAPNPERPRHPRVHGALYLCFSPVICIGPAPSPRFSLSARRLGDDVTA